MFQKREGDPGEIAREEKGKGEFSPWTVRHSGETRKEESTSGCRRSTKEEKGEKKKCLFRPVIRRGRKNLHDLDVGGYVVAGKGKQPRPGKRKELIAFSLGRKKKGPGPHFLALKKNQRSRPRRLKKKRRNSHLTGKKKEGENEPRRGRRRGQRKRLFSHTKGGELKEATTSPGGGGAVPSEKGKERFSSLPADQGSEVCFFFNMRGGGGQCHIIRWRRKRKKEKLLHEGLTGSKGNISLFHEAKVPSEPEKGKGRHISFYGENVQERGTEKTHFSLPGGGWPDDAKERKKGGDPSEEKPRKN